MFPFDNHPIAPIPPANLILALALICVPGLAQASQPDAALLPIPPAVLQDPEAPAADESAGLAPAAEEADAFLFDPTLSVIGRASAASGAHLRARTEIPVDIVRNGFTARQTTMGPAQDRAVGFKLGRDVFSLSTTLSDPASTGATRDARVSWRLARPASAEHGFVWGLATSGGNSLYGNPEQGGEAVIGYRQEFMPHVMLTSQLAMAGNYVFATGGGMHSALTPEMKLSVDLARLADLPWQTSFDVTLARKLPLVASDFETRGRAMLSLKYRLQ